MPVSKRARSVHKTKIHFRISPRALAVLGVFLLIFALLYVILPAVGRFGDTYILLQHAQSSYILIAFLMISGTYIAATYTYQFLALHPLRYARTLLLQVSSSFANRILPAGTGGLALNVQYLRKSRHSTAEAGVVVAVNNGLGFVANMLVLGLLLSLDLGGEIHLSLSVQALHNVTLYVELCALMLIVGLIIVHRYIDLGQYLRPVSKSFAYYRTRPSRLILGLITSAGVCLLYSATLYFAARSLHVNLSLTQALLTMTLSTVGTVLIPTPGGIGGAEAGVVAALVALHVSPSLSLAVALLYRVFTFWTPFIVGAIAFRFSLRYLR